MSSSPGHHRPLLPSSTHNPILRSATSCPPPTALNERSAPYPVDQIYSIFKSTGRKELNTSRRSERNPSSCGRRTSVRTSPTSLDARSVTSRHCPVVLPPCYLLTEHGRLWSARISLQWFPTSKLRWPTRSPEGCGLS